MTESIYSLSVTWVNLFSNYENCFIIIRNLTWCFRIRFFRLLSELEILLIIAGLWSKKKTNNHQQQKLRQYHLW